MKTTQTLSIYLCLSILLCLGSTYGVQEQAHTANDSNPSVVDLNASTEIVIALLKLNALGSLFNEADQELLALCVKNMSPADIALEVEALNHPGIIVLTYFKQGTPWDKLKPTIDALAKQYTDMTFVNIESEQLFKLAEYAQVEQFPSILFLENRQEIQRLEPVDATRLPRIVTNLAQKHRIDKQQ